VRTHVQVKALAASVQSCATPDGTAEALKLVACVQREAAHDAVSSGWGADPDLEKFLAEVTYVRDELRMRVVG